MPNKRMLTALKKRLFLRRARAEAKTGPPPAGPVNLTTARNVVVLFPADDATDRKAVDKWRDGFRKSGMKIKFTGYFAQSIGQTNFGFPAVTANDLNWYGAPRGKAVAAYRALECDVLLRLGPTVHKELDYLAATKQAHLRVGPYRPGEQTPYHLQFDSSSPTDLNAQLATIERIFSFTNAK